MKVKKHNNNIKISFEKDFSDVIEHLGARKGMIYTTIPGFKDGIYTNLSYVIAYYELDLNHVYSSLELDMLVKSGKIILLSSSPYMCVDEKDIPFEDLKYSDNGLTTLQEYNYKNKNKNSDANNKLVLEMLKKYNIELSQKHKNDEKSLLLKR